MNTLNDPVATASSAPPVAVGAPLIHIRGVHKSFGDNHVLKGFDMDLFPQENLVIIGKSGSGKSVLIKCLVGLEYPDEGVVEILGKNLLKLSQIELD